MGHMTLTMEDTSHHYSSFIPAPSHPALLPILGSHGHCTQGTGGPWFFCSARHPPRKPGPGLQCLPGGVVTVSWTAQRSPELWGPPLVQSHCSVNICGISEAGSTHEPTVTRIWDTSCWSFWYVGHLFCQRMKHLCTMCSRHPQVQVTSGCLP